jgi:hypothetical protein
MEIEKINAIHSPSTVPGKSKKDKRDRMVPGLSLMGSISSLHAEGGALGATGAFPGSSRMEKTDGLVEADRGQSRTRLRIDLGHDESHNQCSWVLEFTLNRPAFGEDDSYQRILSAGAFCFNILPARNPELWSPPIRLQTHDGA